GQSRRLLRAALCRARAAFCLLYRLGRDLGLSLGLEAADQSAVQGFTLGARTPHHVDSGGGNVGGCIETARAVQARWRRAKNALPVPGGARRGRRADSARRCAGAL